MMKVFHDEAFKCLQVNIGICVKAYFTDHWLYGLSGNESTLSLKGNYECVLIDQSSLKNI